MTKSQPKSNLNRNIIFNVIKTLVTIAYPVLSFMYVARILSVEAMGEVTFAKNVVSYFSLISSLGISYYGIREGARVAQDKYQFSKLFWEIFFVNCCSTLVSYILLFGVLSASTSLAPYRGLILINSVSVALCGLSNEWVLSAREEYRFLSIRSVVIQLLCLAGVFLLIHREEDYIIYAALLIISGNGISLLNHWHILRSGMIQRIPLGQFQIVRHLKPIFVLFAMLLSIDLYTMLDTTMLGLIQGDYAVGIYNGAIKIPRLTNSVIAAVGAVLVPKLSYYYENDREKFERLSNKAIRYIILITLPSAAGICFLSEEIVTIFAGEQYADSFITTKILALIVLIIPVSVLFNNQIFIPMRKEVLVLKGTCVGAAVNMTLNAFLIPAYAENGAAIATVIAEFCVMLVCLYHAKRELRINNVFPLYIKGVLTTVPVIVIALGTKLLLENIYMRLGIAICAGAAVYFFLNRKEIKNIVSKL